MREFGILIDQAGFQRIYYWCARVDLFFFDTELPKGSWKTWKGCNCFGRIASPVTILGYVTHDAGVKDVNFEPPATSISVNSDAKMVAVNCGTGACHGLHPH